MESSCTGVFHPAGIGIRPMTSASSTLKACQYHRLARKKWRTARATTMTEPYTAKTTAADIGFPPPLSILKSRRVSETGNAVPGGAQ